MGDVTFTIKGRELDQLLARTLRQDFLPIGALKDSDTLARFQSVKTEDPDYIDKIMQGIESDFYLASQTIFQANSQEFSVRPRVENLKQAVVRLGIRHVQGIGMNYDPDMGASAETSEWMEEIRKLQKHSVLIATGCYYYSKVFRGKNPDNCYLLGFFHEIGAVYLTRLIIMEVVSNGKDSLIYGAADDRGISHHIKNMGNKFNSHILEKGCFPEYAVKSMEEIQSNPSADNYFYRALEAAHILEESFGEHLAPHKEPDPRFNGKPAAAHAAHKDKAPLPSWEGACSQAASQVNARFPATVAHPDQISHIAEQVQACMKKHVALMESADDD